ncbi:MAG TPA: 2-dehydropantoate 2-reductase N-terminal domain-containing protein [Natronosporangium sp.]
MHYVIIGAGAVGGTIGGRLHQHGHRVTLVARGAHHEAIEQRGLLLATPEDEYKLDVPVIPGPDGLELEPDTVLVLAVKSQDTAAAVAAWADVPVRGGGVAGDRLPVLCVQNGVANERLALRLFERVYGVCVWLPATYLTAGTVQAESHPNSGMLHIGRYPRGSDELAKRVAADLSGSRFVAPVRDDVMRWKYGKLLANLSNGLEALFGSADQELAGRLRAEGMAVLDAAGIAYTSREEEVAERGDLVKLRPVAGQRRAGGSTWQSLVRGAGSVEVDYLNGEIVRLGREHGVPTPLNLAVQRAVRRAVRDGIGAGEYPLAEFQAQLGAAEIVGQG